jgi:hypothetical protein
VAELAGGFSPLAGVEDVALPVDEPAPELASASREAGAVSPTFDSEEFAPVFVGLIFFSQLKATKKLNKNINLENMFLPSALAEERGMKLRGIVLFTSKHERFILDLKLSY